MQAYEIPRRISRKREYVNHVVYDEEMAKEEGIVYKPWRECGIGDWGLSDDGFVGECFERRKIKKSNKQHGDYYVFSFACIIDYPTTKLLFIPRWENKKYSGLSAEPWYVTEMKTRRFIPVIAAYVNGLLKKERLTASELNKYYRSDGKFGWVIKRIMKTKEWDEVIKKEVRIALSERDMDEGKVLDIITDAVDIAKEKKDAANMLRGAEGLVGLLDMKPEKKQVTKSLEMSRINEIEGKIEREEELLKLTEQVDGQDDYIDEE